MTTRAPLDGFETALLAELRQHVADQKQAPARRPSRRRRLVAAGAALGAAVAVTAGGLALRPDAAFAVDPQANGDIVVTISSLEDADGLESALRAQGIDADVDYTATPPAVPPPGAAADGGTVEHSVTPGTDDDPGKVVRHETPKGTAEPAGPCGGRPPTPEDREASTVRVERNDDGVTFTLSKSFVDSDTSVHITTSGTDDGAAGIMVQVEKTC